MNTRRAALQTPRLIVLSAPSGAGKTTLCARLLEDFQELRLSISTTTRAPRGQEKHGEAYFFASEQEFKSGISEGRFAEWALVHGNYYGTSRKTLEDFFREGFSVLLDIDVQGSASLKKTFGARCDTIFISPPSMAVLEQRLRARGTDSEESILRRMRNAELEMSRASEFDHVLINDDLEGTSLKLKALVSSLLRSGGV
ncbi:MAG: guanylate kinase [Oligoflexia bacterium]|jgi:guanylate kinase